MKTELLILALVAATSLSGAAFAQDPPQDAAADSLKGRPYSPYADRGFPMQVFFGDTHVHSALSADAGGGGTTLMPRDMYRFARGEQVTSNTGQPVKLSRPFDFYMLTEHTDGMGVITDIIRGAPNIMADPDGKRFHDAFAKGGDEAKQASIELIAKFSQGTLSPALLYQPGTAGYDNTWRDLVQAAEEFNSPHIFTAMIAYEWTSLVAGDNLHRNVIFRDGPERALQVVPFLMSPPAGSADPRDLWKWMQAYEDKTGGDVLAIPHNPNLSNGRMFAPNDTFRDGVAFDVEYLKTRHTWERLLEIQQTKGDSETHLLISPTDEFADYETWDWANLDVSAANTDAMIPYQYARGILKEGIRFEAEQGVNPFKLGFVGGSDIHTGLTTGDDANFFGAFTWMEPSATRATTVAKGNVSLGISYKGWQYATPGPTAVWATENTRSGIFDAMERREVYSTTGPRITVRFFGGAFTPDDVRTREMARVGYTKGVPMGSDLIAPDDGTSPSFLVYALRDPIGANLDRIQIIKGWVDTSTGETKEQVYDVVWSGDRKANADGKLPDVGNTVDLTVPSWTNDIGAPELATVWTDPDFDPEGHAFYYARVIEIPTPRWTAYDAVRFGVDMPSEVKMITRERAYTSPIWFTPSKD